MSVHFRILGKIEDNSETQTNHLTKLEAKYVILHHENKSQGVQQTVSLFILLGNVLAVLFEWLNLESILSLSNL